MRSTVCIVVLAAAGLATGGCPGSIVPVDDAGSGLDAATPLEDAGTSTHDAASHDDAWAGDDAVVPSADAFVLPDARVAEACETPGVIEMAGCGRCGMAERFCNAARVWEYGACAEPVDAVCDPGTTTMVPCGDRCGMAPARCDVACHWVNSGPCVDAGECSPGASERTADGCAPQETRGRTCGAACAWGAYAACLATPTDFDGDGVPYAMDCDDGDPAIVIGSSRSCGTFACDGTPIRTAVAGSQTCTGPGWSVCARAPTCIELPTSRCGASGYNERRPCPTAGCDDPRNETRECRAGRWSSWSGCSAPPRARPASCELAVSPCGSCGEGIAVSHCDSMCNPLRADCAGDGCIPGTIRRTPIGCAAGTFRELVCDVACVEGLPGPCVSSARAVDVLLLVDDTGSHTELVVDNATVLATELVGGLLADADVRVGVAAFTDFPHTPFGSTGDVAFDGLLAPTSDMASIAAALASIDGGGGGDGPEGGVEALWVAGGGPAHPDSNPLACAAGLEPGGCWRVRSQRLVIMMTDATQHEIPSPADGGDPVVPYTGFLPFPPTWEAARDRLVQSGVGFFAMVPEGMVFGLPAGEPRAQMRYVAAEVGMLPDRAVVTYPVGTRDLTMPVRVLVANLRLHLGIGP